ncbi:sulfide:quinone oxidoreductase, mitochondrial-like [Onthophagus taurus]|uniref:sulfide:quinone oxidoreductase, mitochondrial-like n=1 Tax=Onthophagus taurus TaxID=166361 RepID=UPI0039BE3EB6
MLRKVLLHKSGCPQLKRCFSVSNNLLEKHNCKVLVVGGGTGGCTVAAKLTKWMKKDEVIVLEPADKHYYQPLFTLCGGGIKTVQDSYKSMQSVLPPKAKWIKKAAGKFDPDSNTVTTVDGDIITYDVLVVATGLQLRYEKIPGLVDALEKFNNVGSIYLPQYAEKTFKVLQGFKDGDAIFTYPQSPVKCPGAPQKICYISEDVLKSMGKRGGAKITYNTSLPVIFGVKRYADALWEVVKKRDIKVNLQTSLVEVKPDKNEAVFENLETKERFTSGYSMLHAVPPMSPPDVVTSCKQLVNEAGFVDVNKDNLQHVKYPNVFAIGDCSSSPNSKTTAAVAAQAPVVHAHIKAFLTNDKSSLAYNGYASCPLVTGYRKCILAEFDYDLTPQETFPIAQNRELWSMYVMKKDFMPVLYWNLMLKGNWNGPQIVRKMLRLGF